METIKAKIEELLKFNDIEPVFGKRGSTDPNEFDNIMKRQDELMDELKPLARAKNTLMGRIVKFQMADSHAVYVVTKVNARTVQLTWVRYCDAWQDDRVGYQSNISRDYVQKQINFSDWWESETNPNRVKINAKQNV
jgi:hypothetical protein